MKISAAVSIVPVKVSIEAPDDTPICEIRDKIIEQARFLVANNGAEHVVLAASHDGLVDSIPYLNDLGFPVLTEYVIIEPPEPDWNELAEFGCLRSCRRDYDQPYSPA